MNNKSFKIIVRVEFQTLTGNGEQIDPQKFDRLARIVSNLRNSGEDVIIVSSGAIALGLKKIKENNYINKINENSLTDLQAIAAIGQAELIREYQNYFDEYNQIVAQVLFVSDIVNNIERVKNAQNTFDTLLEMNIIPVVNENDAISTIDIELNDNYPLSVMIAKITKAQIILIKLDKNNEYLLLTRDKNDCYLASNEIELYERIKEYKNKNIENIENDFPESIDNILAIIK